MSKSESRITLRVQAGARSDRILGLAGGVVRISVAAPAREGRANAAVVALLARTLGVPESTVRVHRGHTSRTKIVVVEGVPEEELLQRLLAKSG